MVATWDEFPACAEESIVENAPAIGPAPKEQVLYVAGRRCLELPDNGYQLLLAWVAGPHRVWRMVDGREHFATVTICGDGDLPDETFTEPHNEEDREEIDFMVNSRLAEADVPPRPRGYRWFLDFPAPALPDDLWGSLNDEMSRVEEDDPVQIRQAMERVLADLYADAAEGA